MYINYFKSQLELLNKRIFFSRKHNIMFLTTPKCGSQFVKLFCLLNFTKENINLLYNDSDSPNYTSTEQYFRDYKDKDIVTIEDLNNLNIKKYQIVRNHYKRALSFYMHENRPVEDVIKRISNPHPVDSKNVAIFNTIYLQFYEHLFPQHDWLFSKYFKPIKLENLDEYIEDKLPNSIVPDKSKFRHHKDYHLNLHPGVNSPTEISQKSKNQIYELYRDDFAKFNYKK